MLILNTRLQHTSVMSLQSGSSLGILAEPIIDPRKLQIIAFYVTGSRLQGESVLHTSDIREFGPVGVIVDSADSIMQLDGDLVRLNEVIDMKFSLIGKQVIDEQKRKLGKVVEYSLETEGFFVQKIHVGQSLLKNFTSSNLIIHRTQIVELTDQTIIVRSGAVQEPVGLIQALNPFRKAPRPMIPEPAVRHKQLVK